MNSINDTVLRNHLLTQDDLSMSFRMERLRFLVEEFGEERDLLLFGTLSADLLNEVRLCYLNGLFISCTQAAQCFLEQMLRSMLAMPCGVHSDNTIESSSFQSLCKACLDKKLIHQSEYDEFQLLRNIRNSYTHSKPMFSKKAVWRRAIKEDSDPHSLSEQDARFALSLVFSLLKREPFLIG